MTLEELQQYCDRGREITEDLCPELRGKLDIKAVSTAEGPVGDGSYMHPKDYYRSCEIRINLADSGTHDLALDSIAHEITHALCWRFEHLDSVLRTVIPENMMGAYKMLSNQTTEALADAISGFVLCVLRGRMPEKDPVDETLMRNDERA